jgi:hypothetical protein
VGDISLEGQTKFNRLKAFISQNSALCRNVRVGSKNMKGGHGERLFSEPMPFAGHGGSLWSPRDGYQMPATGSHLGNRDHLRRWASRPQHRPNITQLDFHNRGALVCFVRYLKTLCLQLMLLQWNETAYNELEECVRCRGVKNGVFWDVTAVWLL